MSMASWKTTILRTKSAGRIPTAWMPIARSTGRRHPTAERPRWVRFHTTHSSPDVQIVEVGPRDGLQNEALPLVSVPDKLELIRRLEGAGCSHIEVGAFVSPKWIPQMAGSDQVLRGLVDQNPKRKRGETTSPQTTSSSRRPTHYSVLVPNVQGLEAALSAAGAAAGQAEDNLGLDEIAIFGAASEEFTQRNINATLEESIQRFRTVVDRVREANSVLRVRGYVSTVIACPYQGAIPPHQVARVVEQMLDLGCHEISLGDTIGVGTPGSTKRMLEEVLTVAKPSQLAMHCHDTYGQALVNILVGLEKEIYTIDSSVAGLGGCPYAKGASGNVATEDVLYMLHGMGLSTGIDLEKLLEAGQFICNVLGRPSLSKVALAASASSEKSSSSS